MGTAKYCLAVLVLLLVPAYEAFPYDYNWDDYRRPFTQLVVVPLYTQGTSTVYLDLPQELLSSRESLTLQVDIESNVSIDSHPQSNFSAFNPYCSVNGALLFWSHRIPVDVLPARQTTSISVRTKDLKAGRNKLEFSMQGTMSVNWRYGGDKIFIVYGIHKMWFSEFSAPAQTPPTEKAKDTPVTKKSVKGRDSNIENKLIGLKSLLDKGLITQEDYDRKKAELLDQL